MLCKNSNKRCRQCLEEHSKTSIVMNGTGSPSKMAVVLNESNDLILRRSQWDKAKDAFTDFCRSTSLHGWQHLTETPHLSRGVPHGSGKYMWILIVVASIGVASFFLFTSILDFTSKYVVTNIDTTTAPLNDVFFPSVIVCNINQIRKSLLRGLGLKNYNDIDLLYRQFYTGMDRNLTSRELDTILSLATSEAMVTKLRSHSAMMAESNSTDIEKFMEGFEWKKFLEKNEFYIKGFDFIRDMAVEDPGDSPIISARYGHKTMRTNATDFLPFFGTDIGLCSIVKPQLTFDSQYDNLTYAQKLFGIDGVSRTRQIKPGAKVGKVNGLVLLLDAETFDYTMNRHVSEGFKITVDHHLDQPLMSMTEMDITPGFETQVAVTPVLYTTTNAARTRFNAEERGCYFDNELPLKYLPEKWYRYDINNCLFEAAYEKVLRDCQCTPFFHTLGARECPRLCHGQSLLCMNKILDQIGEFREVEVDETETGGTKRMAKCLEACQDQQNEVAVTTSRLPNRQTMLKWSDFCIVMEKLKKSCNHVWKRIDLDRQYPSLCSLLLVKLNETNLNSFHVNNKELCMKALSTFNILGGVGDSNKGDVKEASDEELLNSLFQYARENLALVNIYIKPPVVTRITKDERIPVIWFVANCGGILGLCMGFSIVTVFEVLHYFCRLIFTTCSSIVKRIQNKKEIIHVNNTCQTENANDYIKSDSSSTLLKPISIHKQS